MKDDPAQKRITESENVVAGLGWDTGARSLMNEVRIFLLSSVADAGTNIDSGGGDGDADLWVKVGGIEYYVNFRKSNNQLAKEGKPIPE